MDDPPLRSVPLARFLLIAGGLLGLHKIYVNRFPEAFVRLSTLGVGLLGLFYDSFTIVDDVDRFNEGSDKKGPKKNCKVGDHVPFSLTRFLLSFCYAAWMGFLAWAAASLTYAKHDLQGGRMMAGLTVAVTLGVYIAGNCGQQRRSLYEIFFAVSAVMPVTMSPLLNWSPLQAMAAAASIGTIIGNRTARRAEPSEDRLSRVHFVLWTSIFLMNTVLLVDGFDRQCLKREFWVETQAGVKSVDTQRMSVQELTLEWLSEPKKTRRRFTGDADTPWQIRFLTMPKREPQYLEFVGVKPGTVSPAWIDHLSAAIVDSIRASAEGRDWPSYVFNRRYLVTMLEVAPLSTDSLMKKKCVETRRKVKKTIMKKEEATQLGLIVKTCEALKI